MEVTEGAVGRTVLRDDDVAKTAVELLNAGQYTTQAEDDKFKLNLKA